MVTSDGFSLSELTGIGAGDMGAVSGLGEVDLRHPTVDLDGDGTLDTATLYGADSLMVVTDTDLDGVADELTIVDDTGKFASWRYTSGADGSDGWSEIHRGTVGE